MITASTALHPRLQAATQAAQQHLLGLLQSVARTGSTDPTAEPGLPRALYIRYLSQMVHMTRNVTRHMFLVASHDSMRRRRALRQFALAFGVEEEGHHRIAESDLHAMGQAPLPSHPTAEAWDASMWDAAMHRPFARLGATCVLENMVSAEADALLGALIQRTPWMNAQNTRYLRIHRHGDDLPHGSQVLAVLDAADLGATELEHLLAGADEARTLMRATCDHIFATTT